MLFSHPALVQQITAEDDWEVPVASLKSLALLNQKVLQAKGGGEVAMEELHLLQELVTVAGRNQKRNPKLLLPARLEARLKAWPASRTLTADQKEQVVRLARLTQQKLIEALPAAARRSKNLLPYIEQDNIRKILIAEVVAGAKLFDIMDGSVR